MQEVTRYNEMAGSKLEFFSSPNLSRNLNPCSTPVYTNEGLQQHSSTSCSSSTSFIKQEDFNYEGAWQSYHNIIVGSGTRNRIAENQRTDNTPCIHLPKIRKQVSSATAQYMHVRTSMVGTHVANRPTASRQNDLENLINSFPLLDEIECGTHNDALMEDLSFATRLQPKRTTMRNHT
mmetsp:Transcript_4141/g.6522  ORF Transcript_4141/g.6522 Transcript_4141/m.6522 type:complete len:178 (+) Transcript_4141:316-849(+)